jgi:hypothetical protein
VQPEVNPYGIIAKFGTILFNFDRSGPRRTVSNQDQARALTGTRSDAPSFPPPASEISGRTDSRLDALVKAAAASCELPLLAAH